MPASEPPPPTSRGVDPGFTALPLRALADAALGRADALGCSYADLRVERIREGVRRLAGVLEEEMELRETFGATQIPHLPRSGYDGPGTDLS